jgi:uncharacterized protein
MAKKVNTVEEIKKVVAPIFSKYNIKEAKLFGSAARGEMNTKSDLDILVSFIKPIDGWTFTGIALELEKKSGRKVDLVIDKSLSKYIKPYILKDLLSIYKI